MKYRGVIVPWGCFALHPAPRMFAIFAIIIVERLRFMRTCKLHDAAAFPTAHAIAIAKVQRLLLD